jgi:hypothetical protein
MYKPPIVCGLDCGCNGLSITLQHVAEEFLQVKWRFLISWLVLCQKKDYPGHFWLIWRVFKRLEVAGCPSAGMMQRGPHDKVLKGIFRSWKWPSLTARKKKMATSGSPQGTGFFQQPESLEEEADPQIELQSQRTLWPDWPTATIRY